jgi:hypothetical protein
VIFDGPSVLDEQRPFLEIWKSSRINKNSIEVLQKHNAFLWSFGDNKKKALSVGRVEGNPEIIEMPNKVEVNPFDVKDPVTGEIRQEKPQIIYVATS